MRFREEINLYLKLEDVHPPSNLTVGKLEEFTKNGARILPSSDISTFLIKEDWTPLAVVRITSYHKYANTPTEEYVVEKVLDNQQRKVLENLFGGMYKDFID